MQIRTRAAIRIDAPREAVFAFTNDPAKFPDTFRGFGPIPGMDRVENQDGGATRKGTVRFIHNRDGTVLEEHMIEHDPPSRMQYEIVAGLRPPFSWLVRGAGGQWTFTEDGGATLVEWRFRFDVRSPMVLPLAFVVGKVLFLSAQTRCLAATKRAIEKP